MAILVPPSQSPAWTARSSRWLLWILGLWFLTDPVTPALAQADDEYHVKALFLYNFAKFVDWPSNMQAGPICVGVLGDNPFGEVLDETVKGKTVNGHGFVVKRLKRQEDGQGCQIVFVSASEKKRLRTILDGLKSCNVLTVGSGGFRRKRRRHQFRDCGEQGAL